MCERDCMVLLKPLGVVYHFYRDLYKLYVRKMFCRSVFWSSGGMKAFYLLLLLHCTEACTLKDTDELNEMTAYTGGSVLLPCSCTERRAKPERFTWIILNNGLKVIATETGLKSPRLKQFNAQSPGNLSLLISDLTEEDTRTYRCRTTASQYSDIQLTVEGCTHQSHEKEITGKVGGSAVLPCSCTALQAKPKTFRWFFYKHEYNEIYPIVETDQFTGRVKLANNVTPGNLYLQISDLTLKDEGWYRCEINNQDSNIKLTVKEDTSRRSTSTPVLTGPSFRNGQAVTPGEDTAPADTKTHPRFIIISAAVGGLLLLLVVGGVIYWRCREHRRGSSEGQTGQRTQQDTQNCLDPLYSTITTKSTADAESNQDEVTYVSIDHNNAVRPARTPVEPSETTEYASIKLI